MPVPTSPQPALVQQPQARFHRKIAAVVVALALGAGAHGQIPAFPGAEGYGAYAVGGRNGDVYHVTNLNASGPGSFADAIATVPAAGRTIVFDVSGYIRLPSGSDGTRMTASKVTIAGQTAPGDGVGFFNNMLRISGDDIVIRHLRFRRGKTDSSGDCINLDSGSLNTILDHVSIQFSTDENISSFGSPPENLTLQYSLNAWGLESHSCGGLWDQNHATCHHTLWAHNHTRNPKARPNGLLEWINNVTFDWDIGFIMGDSTSVQNWKSNVINNYFICPPGNIRSKALVGASLATNGLPNFTVHLSGNLMDNDGDGLLDGIDKGYTIVEGSSYNQSASAIAGSTAGVATDNALTAYKKIVSNAGALRLDAGYAGTLRDEVDTVLINKLTSQAPFHVSSQSALVNQGVSNGGFGTLKTAAAPVDTDQDGMPDYYETALGWNVSADDHKTALASSGGVISGTTFFPPNTPAGYTRLEEYLHLKAIPHATVPKNVSGTPSSLTIDLRKFTSGFSSSPTFTVANVAGGSVALSGTGNAIATFTPTLNHTGRARFEFTVTDSQGSTWTQTFAMVVTNNALPRDLQWKGDGSANVWDTTAPNWLRNGAATAFSGGDFATFDDAGSKSPAVNLVGASASGIVVNAEGNYTFSGTGTLSGALTKRGTGTLTINNTGANALTPATLEEGMLSLPSGAGLGAGTLTISGGTLAIGISPSTAIALTGDGAINVSGSPTFTGTLSGSKTLNLTLGGSGTTTTLAGSMTGFGGTIALGTSSGSLRFNSSSTSITGSAAATFDLGTGTATLHNRNGNLTINLGALSGGPNTRLSGAGSTANATTYSIGANGADTTFAGIIANGSGTTAITKVGESTFTLAGASTYTGTTTVSVGTLMLNGSLGTTATTVASGATLAGGGSYGGQVTLNTGATVSPGAGPGATGTLTAAAGFSATGSTLLFDLSSSATGANDKISITGGAGQLTGTNNFTVNFTEGAVGAGNYKLIECAAGIPLNIAGGMVMNLTTSAPAGGRQTYTLNRTASGTAGGFVQLVVTGNPATLTWTGATSANWDTTTANNWTGATPNSFAPNDAVVFDDSSAVNTITIPAALSPRSILVNNTTRAYTVGGADQTVAAITGNASLTKSGTGALTLTGKNGFSGGTTINSGATITFGNDNANAGALGAGTITLNGGTLTMFDDGGSYTTSTLNLAVLVGQTSTVNADSRCDLYGSLTGGGTLNFRVPWVRTTLYADWSAFTGTINVTTDGDGGDFRMGTNYNFPGFPQATLNLTDRVWASYIGILSAGAGTTIEVGELSGGALSGLMGGATGGRNFTYRIGRKTPIGGEVTFAGTIREQNTGTTTSFVKTGEGTWKLSGTCSWNGGTIVEQGTLKISGSVTCGPAVNVMTGAAVALAGGTLSTDALNIAASATLSGNGTIHGDLNNSGTISCGGGTLTVTGDVVNEGTMRLTGGAALNATSAFVNNGVLDLLTGAEGLQPNLENNGVVIANADRRILSMEKAGTNFTCTVQGYAGHTYRLQRADSLAGLWTNVGAPQTGNGAVLTFSDAGGATGPQRFYRVLVSP